MDIGKLEVKNSPDARRFETWLDGQVAVIEYMRAGNNIVFTHSEVPRDFEGQGIFTRMAKVALDYAVEAGYKIQAVCPLVLRYIERHPEYQPYTWGFWLS